MTQQNPQNPQPVRDPDSGDSASTDAGRGISGWIILALIVVLVVGGYFAYDRFFGGSGTSPDQIAAGDCITKEESTSFSRRGRGGGSSMETVKVDCSAPEAQYAVFGQRPASMGVRIADRPVLCTDFDGATTETATGGIEDPILCLGPVDADPSTSVNTITEGECMVVEGPDARRVDCADPAAMKVLALFRGDFDFSSEGLPGEYLECNDAGAYKATQVYSWGLEEQESFDHEKGVCLAPAGAS